MKRYDAIEACYGATCSKIAIHSNEEGHCFSRIQKVLRLQKELIFKILLIVSE